jgi:hypothetical protein
MKTTLQGFLAEASINSIIAMPLGNVRGFYLDAVFSGSAGAVRFSGEAAEMADRTEAFFIAAEDVDPTRKWTGPDGQPGWPPEDLTVNWKGSLLQALFEELRSVRYYYDPEDRRRGLVGCGVLDAAAAIEFSSRPSQARVILYATPEYPCALELAIDKQRCDEILGKLEEFRPETVDTVLIASPC